MSKKTNMLLNVIDAWNHLLYLMQVISFTFMSNNFTSIMNLPVYFTGSFTNFVNNGKKLKLL